MIDFDEFTLDIKIFSGKSFHEIIEGYQRPTIIHLEGRDKTRPIFVSTLLHGNERSGVEAMTMLIDKYLEKGLPVSLTWLIGNVEAAKHDKRFMPLGEDFNRIWHEDNRAVRGHLVARVCELMKANPYTVCIDVHNNTGVNPYYSCIAKLDRKHLYFASLFSSTAIYFRQPETSQTIFLSSLLPSITLECGRSIDKGGARLAAQFIDDLMLFKSQVNRLARKLNVFRSEYRLKIRGKIGIEIDDKTRVHLAEPNKIIIFSNIEKLNFCELNEKTCIGLAANLSLDDIFEIDPMHEDDKAEVGVLVENGKIYLEKGTIASMFSTNIEAIYSDCLCYLMSKEHYDL